MKGIDVIGSLAEIKLLVSAICGAEMDWRNKKRGIVEIYKLGTIIQTHY